MPPDIQGLWAGGSVTLGLLWGFWLATYVLYPHGVVPGYFFLSILTSLFLGMVAYRYAFQRAMNNRSHQ